MPNNTTNYSFNKPLVNNATDADLWGGYLNANWDSTDSILNTRTQNYEFAGYDLIDAEFIDSSETAHSLGNISGAVTIDYEDGHWQYATVTGDITSLTINNLPPSGKGGWLTLELVQDGTGGHTISLSSAYRTVGGAGVTLSTAASAVDKLRLETRDAGTKIDVYPNLGLA